mgnify:CR=1 FL=1|jgi:exopolysaccharide biosynthesis protein
MFRGLSCALAALATARGADFELLKPDRYEPSANATLNLTVLKDEGGPANLRGHANGYEAVFDNGAPHFRAFPPYGGTPCDKRVKTSVTSKAHGCRWATNGSPFNMDTGACDCGMAISDGVPYGTGGWGSTSFGVTGDGSWVVGAINASVAKTLNITNSVNGFSWLVRNGVVAVGNDTVIAPRTVIGVRADGRLLSLEVDGCEPKRGCLWKLGKTEHDMAELLVKRGALHAINLDGGGSSSVVEAGKVIDHPTNTDRWVLRDERAVTTIVCVL